MASTNCVRNFRPWSNPSVLVWLIAVVGLTAFWWCAKARRNALFCLGFLAFSFLAVCPGFVFTLHYFILLLPAVSLLVSVAVSSATSVLAERNKPVFLRIVPGVVFLVAVAISFHGQRALLFETDPTGVSRAIYGMQPFPEALKVAEYLDSHSEPTARIAVLGSEPEIYFYAHRHSATGYIYMYALMEQQPYALTMQKEMISEIETSRSEFIVLVTGRPSWTTTPNPKQKYVFAWMRPYLQAHYETVGIADIQSRRPHGISMGRRGVPLPTAISGRGLCLPTEGLTAVFATASTLKVGTNSITAMSSFSKASHCCRNDFLDGLDGAFRYLSSVTR